MLAKSEQPFTLHSVIHTVAHIMENCMLAPGFGIQVNNKIGNINVKNKVKKRKL